MNWKKWLGVLYVVLLVASIIFMGLTLYTIANSGEWWGTSEDKAVVSILFACLPIVLCVGGIFGGFFPNRAKSWSTVLVLSPLVFIVWAAFAVFV